MEGGNLPTRSFVNSSLAIELDIDKLRLKVGWDAFLGVVEAMMVPL